jgi:lipopolysaccharide transport system permease protein
MTKRDVVGRYRGSIFGLAWAFFNPLVLISIYTFVFGVIFKSSWRGGSEESLGSFSITLFAGLIVFNLFADAVNSAPMLIVSNVNYVKKVIFPLEILSVVNVISCIFHLTISLIVLLFAEVLLLEHIPWTIVLFPLVCFPLVFMTIGISWILSSLGVFIRDVSQFTLLATTVLMFASPLFYNPEKVPHKLKFIIALNPLAIAIDAMRKVAIWGDLPDIFSLICLFFFSIIVFILGFWWFQKMRTGFADVL